MSTLGEALKGVKQLLLIQKQVEDLEQAAEIQAGALRDMARDVVEIDKRLIRIETMVEIASGRAKSAPRKLPKK